MNYTNLTPAQIAAQNIDKQAARLISTLEASAKGIFKQITATGNPQEVFDAMGNKAQAAVTHYGTVCAVIEQLGGTVSKLPEGSLTFNEDGTVRYSAPAE